jgi:hypothetical protein
MEEVNNYDRNSSTVATEDFRFHPQTTPISAPSDIKKRKLNESQSKATTPARKSKGNAFKTASAATKRKTISAQKRGRSRKLSTTADINDKENVVNLQVPSASKPLKKRGPQKRDSGSTGKHSVQVERVEVSISS